MRYYLCAPLSALKRITPSRQW